MLQIYLMNSKGFIYSVPQAGIIDPRGVGNHLMSMGPQNGFLDGRRELFSCLGSAGQDPGPTDDKVGRAPVRSQSCPGSPHHEGGRPLAGTPRPRDGA